MTRPRLADLSMVTLMLWALTASPANAYIDAGSTHVIFQVAIGGLAAGWMAVRLFWQRLARVFRRDSGEQEEAPSARAQ